MKAMILAAGLGARLRPLTDSRPKALVEIAGRTLLEITIARLRAAGVDEIIVNVHHFADMVVEYLRAHRSFGMRIEVSAEEVLLDTGGGLKQAAWFFLEGQRDEPFILHNVDVLSAINIEEMVKLHASRGALSTLAVQDRKSSRLLLFNDKDELCGRKDESLGLPPNQKALAFSGVHVISPRLLEAITETGVFSIIDTYLRLAASGERILASRTDGVYWKDLGRPENLAQAEQDAAAGRVVLS